MIGTWWYAKIVLEDHTLVCSVYLPKRADPHYLRRVDVGDLRISTSQSDPDLIRRAVSVGFPGECEGSVGDRNAGKDECRVRASTGECGNLPDKCERIGRGEQSIRRYSSLTSAGAPPSG